MLKLTLTLTLIFLTSCMTLKALETQFKTPSRVQCIAEGKVIYDGTPSRVLAGKRFTYIEDEITGQMIKTEAVCTYYYN